MPGRGRPGRLAVLGLGIRPKGERDTVGVNFATKTTRIMGALGDKTLDIQFHEKANAPAVISLLEYVRRKRGKIFAILDNASAHRSKAVDEYVRKMDGRVVLWFLPRALPSTTR